MKGSALPLVFGVERLVEALLEAEGGAGGAGDLEARQLSAAQGEHAGHAAGVGGAWGTLEARRTILKSGEPRGAEAGEPLEGSADRAANSHSEWIKNWGQATSSPHSRRWQAHQSRPAVPLGDRGVSRLGEASLPHLNRGTNGTDTKLVK